MWLYALRRLVLTLPILFGVTIICFRYRTCCLPPRLRKTPIGCGPPMASISPCPFNM